MTTKKDPKVFKLIGARVTEKQWKKFKKQCKKEGVSMQKKMLGLVINAK